MTLQKIPRGLRVGNNAYLHSSYRMVVTSLSGSVVAQTIMLGSGSFSDFTDDVMYFSDYYGNVCQSTDDGVTWSHNNVSVT